MFWIFSVNSQHTKPMSASPLPTRYPELTEPQRLIYNSHVITSCRAWDTDVRAYCSWRALQFNTSIDAQQFVDALERSGELRLCPHFMEQNTVTLPEIACSEFLNAMIARLGLLNKYTFTEVQHRVNLSPELLLAIGDPGKKPDRGWLRTYARKGGCRSGWSKYFVPVENICRIVANQEIS